MIKCEYYYRGVSFLAEIIVSNINLERNKKGIATVTVFKQGESRALTQETLSVDTSEYIGDVFSEVEKEMAIKFNGTIVREEVNDTTQLPLN